MEISIREYHVYHEVEILRLYESVGWTNYTRDPSMLKRAFQNSFLTLAAYDGDRLLGILRAVGDGASVIWIQDILVFPEYQRQGVGTRLMKAVLERCSDVYQIELATDNTDQTVAFYKSLGFLPLEDLGCRGFIKMNSGV